MEGSVVYVMEKSRAEATEHVEAKIAFPQRKFPIHLCQWSMLLGNTGACVCVRMRVCVLEHRHDGSNGVPGLDKKPEPQLPNITLMNSFMQFYVCRD